MKIKIHLIAVLFMMSTLSFAQIGIGTTSPDASAVLDMTSTTQGVLIPRMTTAQRTAIASPAIGLQVYDTDTNSVWIYNGADWVNGTGGPGKFIDGATSDIAFYDGRVGIGLNNFSTAHKLYVDGVKSDDAVNTAARINATYTGTGTSATTTAVGAVASNSGSGTIAEGIANQGILNNSAGGTITLGVGSWQRIENLGTMTQSVGMLSAINNSGTINQGYGQSVTIFNLDVADQVTDGRLSNLVYLNSGTITNAHGLYLDYLDFGGSATNSYALYITDRFNDGTNDNFAIYSNTSADSYFNGNIGAGITAPLRSVHINEAMRLEPQTTAPANGALGDMYAGTDGNLYFHDGNSWRQVQLAP